MTDQQNRPEEPGIESIGKRLRFMGVTVVALVVDVLFLAAWVVVNWGLNHYVIEAMKLEGWDEWLLKMFRWIFGIATLILVLVYLLEDIITLVIQAVRRVQRRFER